MGGRLIKDSPFTPELIARIAAGELGPDERAELLAALERGGDDMFQDLPEEYTEVILRGLLARRAPMESGQEPPAEAWASVFDNAMEEARRLREDGSGGKADDLGPRRRGAARTRLLLLAASLVLAVTAALVFSPELGGWLNPGPITKGPGGGDNGISLQFLVIEKDGLGGESVERGVNRSPYGAGSWLAFRYTIEGPAAVYILRLDDKGGQEVIYPAGKESASIEQPGVYDAMDGDAILLHPLRSLEGAQTYCAVSRESSASVKQIVDQVKAGLDRHRTDDPVLTNRPRYNDMDCFQIRVEPVWDEPEHLQ